MSEIIGLIVGVFIGVIFSYFLGMFLVDRDTMAEMEEKYREKEE